MVRSLIVASSLVGVVDKDSLYSIIDNVDEQMRR